jgi:hypothetical protein
MVHGVILAVGFVVIVNVFVGAVVYLLNLKVCLNYLENIVYNWIAI